MVDTTGGSSKKEKIVKTLRMQKRPSENSTHHRTSSRPRPQELP